MKAQAVIGSNFGDEGKGLITDYLVSKAEKPVVIRFNGGAQAGHTVVLPDQRHVFHHFGSGTFGQAPTFLSEFFVVNPLLYFRELDQLLAKNVRPVVVLDVRAALTTPFDMMINQTVEMARGTARHGSCGVGINETITRNERPEYRTIVADLFDQNALRQKLMLIRDGYVKTRIHQLLGRDEIIPDLKHDVLIDNFLFFGKELLNATFPVDNLSYMKRFKTFVFEGAQGLLLDEFHYWFPHVTRSRTGMVNVNKIAHELGLQKVDAYFATRSYLTRHGAGPLPFEAPGKIYDKIEDTTNITNAYQGSLRFAPLNLDLLKESIARELTGSHITPHLVITCLDQVSGTPQYVLNNQLIVKDDLTIQTSNLLPFKSVLGSYGPTRNDIRTL